MIKSLDLLLMFLFVKRINYFDFTRIEKSVVITKILFRKFNFRTYWITVAQFHLFYFCFWFNYIAVPNIAVVNIWENSKNIVWSYTHCVLSFYIWFENDQCLLLNNVVITKNNFKWFLFSFTQNWTGGIDDASLTKHNISLDFILTHVDCFFIHFYLKSYF